MAGIPCTELPHKRSTSINGQWVWPDWVSRQVGVRPFLAHSPVVWAYHATCRACWTENEMSPYSALMTGLAHSRCYPLWMDFSEVSTLASVTLRTVNRHIVPYCLL